MNPKAASRTQPEADCFWLYMQWSLPAEWYLLPFVSYAVYTEILRLRLRMTVRAGGKKVTLTINCGASRHHNLQPRSGGQT